MSFVLDYDGFGELLRGPEMQAAMRVRAQLVKVRAEATAPVDETGPHPGRYKASFRVESGVREPGEDGTGHTRRAYARVIANAPEAIIVEYGNANTPRHRTLGKALAAAKG